MIQIDLATLVKRLNPFAKQALEMAASECMSQQASEITVAHMLLQMLVIPRSDVRVIAERTGISAEDLRQALTVESYPGGRSAEGYPSFSPMLIEWLKESWLLASAQMQHSELRSGVLLLTLLHSPLRYIPPAAARLLTAINRDQLQQDFTAWTKESAESVDLAGGQAFRATETGDTLLARYAKNMTEDARNGKLDPVLCRDHEIDLMIDILCRRRKNNPVVVGEAGVGKSALIEGLALRIVAGQVPDKLKNTDIMTLDLGALQAGASVKGEFEKRFKGLMAEVISSPVPIILFIDEAHTLIGAGNQQGGLDISNLLKPALARGELKTIAATTWSEYKKYFEKDAALSRRFQLVKVSEPNAAEATIILRGLSAVYEQSHGVLIDDEALQAAATLSERYLSGRQLPDKAIDVLDTACARVAINLSSPPKQISALATLSQQQETEIRQKPYSVVLLDEVEKAHPDVLNLFYQAFDKGEMADGEGRLIDCKNIVFFLTSNLGYQVIVEHADDPETMQEALYPVLADFFKPALLARMEVVPYLPLSKATLATIIAGKLARLDNVLRSRFGADVIIEPEVTDEIMSRVTRAENGARMLESVIDGDMLPPLSLLLLQKMAANTAIARIRLSVADGAFTADVEDVLNDESVTEDETVL
ncbi:AAA family ATPase [Escherichia coli]|uniref:AAA family ATPase n=1 Tax=Escherichia coli TaxID=562 RepID=UPI0010CCA776|nr:AAA family ATPase [Escherichia coli]GCY16871.1 ATP-dependent Clp proteinase [Escherichia coli]